MSSSTRGIYVNRNGVWHPVEIPSVNVNGQWKDITKAYYNNNGTWQQFFPPTGSLAYTSPGVYYFTVPPGIFSVTASVYGAGGGGGGAILSGDKHGGGNGGSGGYVTNQTIATVPNQNLAIIVGAGGPHGGGDLSAYLNGPGVTNGGIGGASYISIGGVIQVEATGGNGGWGSIGDNPPGGPSYTPFNGLPGGAAGSPNGVAGTQVANWMENRNTAGQGAQAVNGTGYGSGGIGEDAVGSQGAIIPGGSASSGQDGAVFISY